MLPTFQGQNVGRIIFDFIASEEKSKGSKIISLNVNKYNKTINFYKKIDFEIVYEEIISIGNGYVMDDYRVEKKL